MIVVRDVFQAKYGKGGALVALLREARQKWPGGQRHVTRILTDASGTFFTVVSEAEVASLAEWERDLADVFGLPGFAEWFARMEPLVESGRREFYNVEA